MSESNWQQSLVIKGACKSHMLANQRYNTAMMYVEGIFGKLQVVLDNLTFDVQQSCPIIGKSSRQLLLPKKKINVKVHVICSVLYFRTTIIVIWRAIIKK